MYSGSLDRFVFAGDASCQTTYDPSKKSCCVLIQLLSATNHISLVYHPTSDAPFLPVTLSHGACPTNTLFSSCMSRYSPLATAKG